MELVLRTDTVDDTRAVGEALAPLLQPGDAVILTGELGAGKTTLVQGAARGLGFEHPVTSPTFTLVHEYDGRLPVVHADVYRLDRIQDVVDLELDAADGVLFVEWGDVVDEVLPPERLRIELTSDDGHRRIALTAAGGAWAIRWERLEQALDPWRAGP